MKKVLLTLCLISCMAIVGWTQKQRENEGTVKEIYAVIINNCYRHPQEKIALSDSTFNYYVVLTNYSEIADSYASDIPYIYLNTEKMDSTWAKTLRKADSLKYKLQTKKVPNFKPANTKVWFPIKNDPALQRGTDKIKFSSVLFIGTRAIVEFSRSGYSLDAEGMLVFLEKRKDKWVVVSTLPLWES